MRYLRTFGFELTCVLALAAFLLIITTMGPASAATSGCVIKTTIGLVSIVLTCLTAGAILGIITIGFREAGR
jgi:hypothetical protein